jgi:CRISPR-associated endonuclease Csn1
MNTQLGIQTQPVPQPYASAQKAICDSPDGLGVRIFPESRDVAEKLAPKNAARRGARLSRRQTRRRRWRRIDLRRVLTEAGLMPSERAEPPAEQDPYALRARGLQEQLAAHELGWAIFHLLKRRGFAGSRKHGNEIAKEGDASKADKEAKDEAEAESKAETLARKMGAQKLATYLAGINTKIEKPERRRDVGQTRAMVTDELDSLWNEQRRHYPEILTPALRQQIEEVSLWQRPSFFRRRTIGQCELETGEERALKADWVTQQFELLQLVNALRLEGGNQRQLDADERQTAIAYLEATARPTWAGLRRALASTLPRDARFTHERGKKESVRGNATEAALRAAIGPDFPTLPQADSIRQAIGAAWHLIEYRPARHGTVLEIRALAEIQAERGKLAARAVAEWGLPPESASRLADIKLPGGTGRHSLKAMQRMMRHLEAGAPYMTALRQEYTVRESGEPLKFLPGPNMSEIMKITDPFVKSRMESLMSGIRNPTVLRTLGELQKVVNALLRVHGRPSLIRLEMARELKQSVKDRMATDAEQRNREKAREAARDYVRKLGRQAEGKDGDENVLRILLWQEQGNRCPYTGEPIGCADALSAAATEIDHIFPRSRCNDNSPSNKVLCRRLQNRDKKRLTPYEYLSVQPKEWLYLTETVWPQMRGAGWPEAKHRRCMKQRLEEAGDEGFTARQLVDTSYIARAARDYLGLLFGGGQAGIDAVQVVPGRATAQLRQAWGIGLSRLLHGDDSDGPKIRDDHRHHAIDALTVALTSPAAVRRLSLWWQEREAGALRPVFVAPWANFHVQAKAAVEAIVVSHRVQAKLSGPLHRDTHLGDTGETRTKGRIEYKLFVKRKAVRELTAKELEQLRDPAVKSAIKAAIDAAGGSREAGLAGEIRLSRQDGSPGPIIRRVRILMPGADGVMRVHATKNIYAELGPGTTAHMLIFVEGSFKVVTRREALSAQRTSGADRSTPPMPAPLMILRPGDVLHRRTPAGDEFRLVRKFFGSGAIFYKPLTMASVPKPEISSRPGPLLADGWRKVSIDPIGRVSPAK